MTAELPEIRLVKLLTITLTEKYTDDIVLVKHLLFIAEKQLRYNKKSYLNYLVLL